MAQDVSDEHGPVQPHDPTDDHSTVRGNLADQTVAQQLAAREMQHILLVTSNFVSTVTTLLASALGFVTALAWNTAVQTWLQTVTVFNLHNQAAKQFSYAASVTVFAVVIIGFLGLINRRVKGQNLLALQRQK